MQVSVGGMELFERTDWIETIDVWSLLQIVPDVSILVPGKHQAEVRDRPRYPIEWDNVVVLELHHRYYFFVKPLYHLSEC